MTESKTVIFRHRRKQLLLQQKGLIASELKVVEEEQKEEAEDIVPTPMGRILLKMFRTQREKNQRWVL